MVTNKRPRNLLVAGVLLVLFGTLAISFLAPVLAQSDSQTVNVRVDQSSMNADISLGIGVLVRYSGNVTLSGGKANGMTLDAQIIGEPWDVSISPNGYIPVAGDTVTGFDGTVAVPVNAVQKTYQLKVLATVDTPGVYPPAVYSDTMNIVVVKNRVRVEVLDQSEFVLTQTNMTVPYRFSFKVTNLGSTADSFSFDLPGASGLRTEGWLLELLGDATEDIKPGSSTVVNLDLVIPANATVGSYSLTLQVKSGKTESVSQATATINVVPAPVIGAPHQHSWSFLGLGYIAWSIISIAVIGVCMMVAIGGTEVGYFAFLVWVFVPLYCRIMKDKVLDNFTRGEIYGYIKANPGAHYMELQGQLDLPNGVLAHHLMVLEREEFIKVHRDGFYKRFYPRHVKVLRKEKLLSRLQKQVLTEVEIHPGISQKTLASYLDESKQIISYHIKVLHKAGLVRVEKEGGTSKVFPIKASKNHDEEVEEVLEPEIIVTEAAPAGTGPSESGKGQGGHGQIFGRL